MKVKSGTPLTSFLSNVRNPADVLSRYIGKVIVVNYGGTHRFYRAAGFNAKGKAANAFSGEWWADESFLVGIGGQLESSSAWVSQSGIYAAWPPPYKALMAISHDWDDACEIFALEIPFGQELEGLCGISKQQPEYSVNDPFKPYDPDRIYVDRPEQVYFAASNPLWIRKVSMWQL